MFTRSSFRRVPAAPAAITLACAALALTVASTVLAAEPAAEATVSRTAPAARLGTLPESTEWRPPSVEEWPGLDTDARRQVAVRLVVMLRPDLAPTPPDSAVDTALAQITQGVDGIAQRGEAAAAHSLKGLLIPAALTLQADTTGKGLGHVASP